MHLTAELLLLARILARYVRHLDALNVYLIGPDPRLFRNAASADALTPDTKKHPKDGVSCHRFGDAAVRSKGRTDQFDMGKKRRWQAAIETAAKAANQNLSREYLQK